VAGVVWYINKAPLPFTTTGQQPKLPPPVASKPPAATPEVPPVASAPVALPGKPGDPVTEKPRFDFYKILPGNAEAIPDPKPEEAKPARPGLCLPSRPKPKASRNEADRNEAQRGETGEGKPAESKPTESRPNPASKTAESKPAPTPNRQTVPGARPTARSRNRLYLQAGSFQSANEADNQKARLALLGTEAQIQQVMLQDKVWYRVRIGPYQKIDDVNHLRADLARQGIDANVVRKD
jgi:cell division protein FtsN